MENEVIILGPEIPFDFEEIKKQNEFFAKEAEKRHLAYLNHLNQMYTTNIEENALREIQN